MWVMMKMNSGIFRKTRRGRVGEKMTRIKFCLLFYLDFRLRKRLKLLRRVLQKKYIQNFSKVFGRKNGLKLLVRLLVSRLYSHLRRVCVLNLLQTLQSKPATCYRLV